MSALIWLLVPVLPLLAAACLWRLPARAGGWLWLCALPALLLSLWPAADLPLPMLWPGAQWGLTDSLGQIWLGFSALLWLIGSRFASFDLQGDPHARRFWTCWLLALSGNLLLIIAADAASFYIGFTLMSLAAYGLVVHLGGPKPRQAGRIYLQLAVLGEMLLYAGLMMRVHEAGGLLLLADWQQVPLSPLTAALLLIGFGLKAGFWPLHVWLPLAHPAAPAAASAVLSGAMIKAGILGLWRFMPENDPLLQSWGPALVTVGLISALLAVVLGLMQTKAKNRTGLFIGQPDGLSVDHSGAGLADSRQSPGDGVIVGALCLPSCPGQRCTLYGRGPGCTFPLAGQQPDPAADPGTGTGRLAAEQRRRSQNPA